MEAALSRNIQQPSGLADLIAMSDDALHTEDHEKDHTFDLDSSIKEDADHMADVSFVKTGLHILTEMIKPVPLLPAYQDT